MKTCGNAMPIISSGGIELAPKVCNLPWGHPGNHSDGSARWYNLGKHIEGLETRNAEPRRPQ